MAAPPILLVADDLSLIAAVKRVLAREGYECVLATSAADAVIAWGHVLPGLVLLQPSVESDRGVVALEELLQHPDAQLLRVVLLGETVPGFAWPVEPLPLDGPHLAQTIEENLRSGPRPDGWEVRDIAPPEAPSEPPPRPAEPEAWRATAPPEVSATAATAEVPEPRAIETDAPPTPPGPAPQALEEKLFGDIDRELEAETLRAVATAAGPLDVTPPAPSPAPPRVSPPLALRAPTVAARHVDALARAERARAASRSAAANAERRAAEQAEALATVRAGAAETEARLAGELAAARAALEDAGARHIAAQAQLSQTTDALEDERRARQRAEQELAALRASLDAETGQRDSLTGELAAARALAEAEGNHRKALEAEVAALREQLEALSRDRDTATGALERMGAERDEATAKAARESEARSAAAAEAAEAQRSLEEVIAAREVTIHSLEESLARAREDADTALALASEAEADRQRLAEARSELEVTKQLLAETRESRDAAQQELLAVEAARDELQQRVDALQADLTSATELLEDTAKERDALRARVAALEPAEALARELSASLEAEGARRQAAEAALAVEVEARAAQQAKIEALEAQEVLSISLPSQRLVGVPRHGSLDLEGTAHLVTQLAMSNLEVRLELGVTGGVRTLWFKRGQLVAAESSLESESLVARARRDGLIDARQESELRMMRAAPPREQLEALKARGFIRDIESVPLVQRYTEQVALDAFTEPSSQYRLAEESPQPPVLLATVPRATLPMLAEALRRAASPDELLSLLGGGEAVASATDSELDLRALGFSERERKMLSWVDGEASVEDLSLASGLKPDAAFRALLVAKWLGLITLAPGTRRAAPAPGQLEERRLEAKYEEVQDADYFTILGLPRSAGADEVRRAYERLSQEFDPLRFSGHPDPTLQQRAQVVASLLEEAARALEDDRRRVEYARHLLD